MNTIVTLIFGWLVPGGAYLLARRYVQFAFAMALVCIATVAGLALQGSNVWPSATELQGLDAVATGMAKGGAIVKAVAGAPYLLAFAGRYTQSFLAGQTNEYGTILLELAGLFNLLALADAMELRKCRT